MKKMFWIACFFVLKTNAFAQKILGIDKFPNLFLNIQSMIELSTDTIRVGGITPMGEIHWMDFKTLLSTKPIYNSHRLLKPNLDFKPTALQFLDAHQLLLAGSRHQDTLEWAIWNTASMSKIKGGVLPDSLRRGQINVVHRLNNGKILFGGKKYGDLQLIQTDSVGKVQKVLHAYKELKDEIWDIFECNSNEIILSGYLKDNMLIEKLIYILNIDSSLAVRQTTLLGNTDSLNVAYSSIVTPEKQQIVAGTNGMTGLVMWLDSVGNIAHQLPLKKNTRGYKNIKIQNIRHPFAINRHRIWANDGTGAVMVFWLSSPN
jgi:hypothetical protein